jgi:NAD(P)-dependent dehydrogenase (short-subunit alcohol dehydrogenase family)
VAIKRALIVGAETELGRACAESLAEAGMTLALVAGTTEGEAAFAVKRLASKLGAAASQAIDASNEAAVRVMLRQISKETGGLDAVIDATGAGYPHFETLARREMDRTGRGVLVVPHSVDEMLAAIDGGA